MDPATPKQVAEQAVSELPSPSSDAEKIRLKRLAKLQQNTSDNSVGTSRTFASSSSTASATAPTSLKSQSKQLQQQKDKGRLEPMNTTSVSPKPKQPVKSFEDWQNDVISKILQITLDKSSAEKSDSQLIYLYSQVAELKEEDPEKTSFKLSQSILESALVARLSINPDQMSDDEEIVQAISKLPRTPTFDYLLDSWKRAVEIKKNLLTRASKTLEPSIINERVNVLDTIKDLLVNYAGLIIQYPDMFPQVNNSMNLGPEQLVPRLLADVNTTEGLPWDFIQELSAKIDEEGFEQVFGPALIGLTAQMRSKKILDDFLRPLNCLLTLTEIKSLAAMLPTLRCWNPPNLTAKTFEVMSLLGPFCRLSVFPLDEPTIAESYFSNVQQRSKADVDSAMISLRGAIRGVQKSLFNIFNNIVRSSPSSKEAVLSYFATVIKLNEKRAQMQVDPSQVGTDGFLMNLSSVLLTFADPFMGYTKIDRIDVNYFRKSKRIDISQETKIKATQQESDAYYSLENEKEPPNFISEIFFITLAIHHYGPLQCYDNYNNLNRDLMELQKQYDGMRADQPNWAGTPAAAINEVLLKRCKDQLDKWASHKIAYDSQLLDPESLSHSLQFYNLVINWVLRIVDPTGQHPKKQISLPLPPTPPKEFIMLPEFIIEDVTEFFLFISRYNPRVILSGSRDELIIFIITFLKSSSYIKNPYLKAKFVEILFYYTTRNDNEGGMGAILNSHPISLEHLMSSLMSFYVEVEQTGMHTQFYDKFNIRYNISQIFNSIWNNQDHRNKLREESRKTESFVKFANLLMNDATYLLDESLKKLVEIRNLQNEMSDTAEWNRQTPQHRQEREGLLRSLERQATSYMALGNETVHMLEYMTSEVVEPFITPQIVDRLAAMLDYNLDSLVGPRCTELKVRNPDKYRFQPRTLLQQLITVYLNLCKSKEFVQAVARDGRSYKKELFSKASEILKKYSLKLERDVEILNKFVNDVEEVIKMEAADDEELGDIPDEFLDPLMYEIMEDPVILPESRVSIDRKSITTHLLSDATDPFNRKPLTIDQVIPNTELKERIETFKREKREKRNI